VGDDVVEDVRIFMWDEKAENAKRELAIGCTSAFSYFGVQKPIIVKEMRSP
jgi:hypothetical protein